MLNHQVVVSNNIFTLQLDKFLTIPHGYTLKTYLFVKKIYDMIFASTHTW
jgi:hypothetical protein